LAANAPAPSATAATPGPRISVASVSLPELVDRPQLVVRGEGPQVELFELHRWAEPLKSGIARLIAIQLSGSITGARVAVYPENAALDADYQVHVDIQRFESLPDGVHLDALWTIRCLKGEPTRSGAVRLHEKVSDSGQDAIVSAYSRAVTALGMDISRAFPATPPR